jgi:uncharacterized OB-fold protein
MLVWNLRATGAIATPATDCKAAVTPSTAWEPFVLSGHGTVVTYSVVHQPPLGHHGEVPYLIAIIALAEGPMITAQLSDCQASEVHIGMAVEMVTRLLGNEGEDGLLLYGYKFRPVM